MRTLALDPGAKRMGWAVLDAGVSGPRYYGSGIIGLDRGTNEKYQDYRVRLIKHVVLEGNALLLLMKPYEMVSEILPVSGFNNMAQPLLAATAITVMQTLCWDQGIQLHQIGATTVKARIAGNHKGSKVSVRNGVLQLLPELAPKKKQWVKEFDEPDAIAIGLTHLGFDLRTPVV